MMSTRMQSDKIVPQIIPTVPRQMLHVTYGNNLRVLPGVELTPSLVQSAPQITWNSPEDHHNNGTDDTVTTYYTLALIDPDAPSRKLPLMRFVVHWLVGNVVSSGDVQTGNVLAEYRGSGPPRFSGLHRYIFLLYRQKRRLHFDEKYIGADELMARGRFSLRDFLRKYDLADEPLAANYFQAGWDSSVSVFK